MKGLELSYSFFLEHGEKMLEEQFGKRKSKIAVGLVGEGSECFGFDDDISQDHDFEPAFCLWVTRDDYEIFGFELERAYSKLPKNFEGYSRQPLSAVGGNRHGVMVIEDFYKRFLGTSSAPASPEHWLSIPTHSLACATNGEVFYDELGEFSKIRRELLSGYPRDVKFKKLSAHCAFMAQSGLYNYERLIRRGENGAAQLAIFEFVRHTISSVFLLNDTYEPFYKWSYRMMRALTRLSELEAPLSSLTELGNSKIEVSAKTETMAEICDILVKELKRQGLTNSTSDNLDTQAFALQKEISSPALRNMHIMDGI